MRIAIDARFANPKNRGLSCYARNLLRELEKQDKANEYFILLRKYDMPNIMFSNRNFHKVEAEVHWYGFKEQFVLPKILKKINPDLTHFLHFNVPFFYNRPFIVTIHDLTLLSYPTRRATTLNRFWYMIKESGYKLVINHALKKSKYIISVSRNTSIDIKRHFPKINKEKIKIIYEGLGDSREETIEIFSQSNSEERQERLKKIGIKFPYILYLGGAYPHKNLEKLILAFKDVYESNKQKTGKELYLILAGGSDYFFKRLGWLIKKNKIKNIILPGFINPGQDLEFLYNEALYCIFPSLCEGFGLPPLEALRRKKLVLASKNSCFPEILKDSAMFFDGKKRHEMRNKMNYAIYNLNNLEDEYLPKAKKILKLYSWKKMAQETIEVYEK